jgi:hypothetical protein
MSDYPLYHHVYIFVKYLFDVLVVAVLAMKV